MFGFVLKTGGLTKGSGCSQGSQSNSHDKSLDLRNDEDLKVFTNLEEKNEVIGTKICMRLKSRRDGK